jgi:hypothetical protein
MPYLKGFVAKDKGKLCEIYLWIIRHSILPNPKQTNPYVYDRATVYTV